MGNHFKDWIFAPREGDRELARARVGPRAQKAFLPLFPFFGIWKEEEEEEEKVGKARFLSPLYCSQAQGSDHEYIAARVVYDPVFDPSVLESDAFSASPHVAHFFANAEFAQGGLADFGAGVGTLSVYVDDLFTPVLITPVNVTRRWRPLWRVGNLKRKEVLRRRRKKERGSK